MHFPSFSNRFPTIHQKYSKDCGPVCLQIILKYYKVNASIIFLRSICHTGRLGTILLDLKRGAEKCGFKTLAIKSELLEEGLLSDGPVIAYLPERKHYVVIYRVTNKHVYVSDPSKGRITYSHKDFNAIWKLGKDNFGIALILSAPEEFSVIEERIRNTDNPQNISIFIRTVVKRYSWYFFQLVMGILSFSLLQVLIPVLTQRLIDTGIHLKDTKFIYIILLANVAILVGKTFNEVTRSWLLLHLSSRLNIALLFTFFKKILALPISFFDTKVVADYLQRIEDHARVENLITTSSLNVLFSAITLCIYTVLLGFYSKFILLAYLVGSFVYFLWISFFFNKRKEIDEERFERLTKERAKVLEILDGMQEIKLQNLQHLKLREWTVLQLRLFEVKIKSLKIDQLQSVGSNLINELKNILLIVLSALLVVRGELSLGMLLAISYVIGVLNTPLNQIFFFIKSLQDTGLSINRIDEIHEEREEFDTKGVELMPSKITGEIEVKGLSFKYYGEQSNVFSDLSLQIPLHKTTAIVGPSGSGKTTLLKILLKFYPIEDGKIMVGGIDLNLISNHSWRSICGSVMQEGFIFNDTIDMNITLGEKVDLEKLKQATSAACISDFIEELPTKYQTTIGNEGRPLSVGQKQRILIARAIYKEPQLFLFDEATSSLDATNEKNISVNLNECFKGKTAIIIAHRLSTIKSADKIIVIDGGKVVEQGTHQDLLNQRGYYHELIKNQLT